MAPLLFALALFAQDAPAADPSPDGPMATAVPRKQTAAPLPIQGGAVSAPTDDYGYVAWCYGAIASYVELYDRAMPEVIRIERAWPTPSTEENISEVYPAQREEGKRNLILFAHAMLAAEKASPTPIQNEGVDAVRRGRAMWTGATTVPKAQLAQFWMSWSPPAKCQATAKALEARSLLFGQALSYNTKGVTVAAPPSEAPPTALALTGPAEGPNDDADVVTTPASDPALVYAEARPSEDPEVEVSGATTSPGPTEPIIDPADVTAGAAEPAEADSPSAIDALLPVGEPEAAAPAPAAPEPAAAPPVAPPPVAAPPAPAKPPVRKHKRGLRETLTGMRGRQ